MKDYLEKISSSSEYPQKKQTSLIFIYCFPFFFLPTILIPGSQRNTKLQKSKAKNANQFYVQENIYPVNQVK